MDKTVLVTASTYRHLHHFHLPYLRAFQAAGWQVHAACAGPPDELPCAHRLLDIPFTKRMTAPQNWAAAAKLRRAMKETTYDLVITHTSLAAFFTRMAIRGLPAGARPRTINVVHGYLFDRSSPPLKRAAFLGAERLAAPVTDLVLTMNRQDYEIAVDARLGRQVRAIPGMGVDFSRFQTDEPRPDLREKLNLPQGAFVLLYAAEFSARKNQQLLLRAMAELPEHIWLLLPGDGALLSGCRELAQSLGVADRVVFPGHVTDMDAWYAGADAVVSASRSEGLPFHLMEAMYCGLPVAATDVKGHQDLLVHGRTGLLFPPDDEQACRAALSALAEGDDLRRALSAAAREEVEGYSLEQVLPQVMAHYGAIQAAPVPADV